MNQYFDKEKGFCLNVLGGGKALYINNTSCGTNVLKPHCYNPRYYYICKRNKTILAQCSQNKHFEVHLQKCTLIYHGKNIPNKTNSNSCERVGVFPIPNDCHQFYTCTAYGHRMKQNFYICPRNMAFDTKTEMCKPSKTCKESRLSSTCLFSSEKEEMTLEEANMFLRPMDQKEKSLTCETIFTNDEETITTERNYNNNEIKSTTTSYNKPSISKFTEPSDRNFTTTIERASETSHSTNTIASEIYTTAIYSPANEEITYTTEQNLSTEIKKNGEENLDSSTSKESYKQEHNGKTDNDNVQSTDAMKIFSTEPTILNDTISTGTGSETQSDIEIKTPPNELPNFENQHSTTTAEFNDSTTHHWYVSHNTPATKELGEPLNTEKEIIDLPSAKKNNNNNSDVEEPEINLNDPSSEFINITPNIEIPNTTPATDDLNEPLTIDEEITDLPSITIKSNLDEEEYTKINSNDPPSEIPNITQPNIKIPNSTPVTEDLNEPTTEKEIIDLSSATINDNTDVEKPEINLNDPEFLNATQPNIEIPNSTPVTEDLNELLATEKEIIDLPPAINDNPDVEKPEINLNDPEFLNTTQPNIEIPNSTPVTEDLNESVTEKEIIDLLSSTTDTIINSNPDVEEHTELEITSNDPSSEIPNITQPNIDMSYSTPATEDLNEPTTEKEIIDLLPSTTDTITNSNPDIQQTESEITSNDPSSEIPNITQPNIEIPYSTPATEDLNEPATEKEIIDSLSSTTDRITNSNPDIQQTESEITSNDPLSGILNTGEHNIEIPNSTPVTIKSNKSIEKENSDFISIMTNNDSEVENKKKIDINLNDPLSEILVTGIPNTEIEHSIVTTIKVTEYSTFESESSDTVSEIPFNTLTSIKENDTVINVSDPSMEITTPSLENIVTNGEETFMKISNNDRTENNIFAESVTDAMESSSISENINNNFQSYVSPISVNPASYSSMISENKVEEPTSIPITDRIALNKNEENNTPSIEFNMKTNSPTEINTKYTTISINKKLDNIGNEKLTLSSDTDISETDKSISQTNKLTTSFRDLIAKCKNHMSAETTTQSTKLNPSNEKYSDPFHMQSHSLVSDKKNANKQNKIFEEEEDSLWKRIYSGKTISKNFILPITSAVLNFVDKFECYLKNTLIKIFH